MDELGTICTLYGLHPLLCELADLAPLEPTCVVLHVMYVSMHWIIHSVVVL